MAVTDTPRLGLTQWSSGSDPVVTRAQLDGDNLAVDTLAAGFLQDAAGDRPAAAAELAGFFFWATDTEVLSYCDGDEWVSLASGAFLPLAGGSMTGDVDFDGNELTDVEVSSAKDKKTTANVSGAVTIDANTAALHVLTMTGNVSGITVNNLDDGESLRVLWVEDGTGGRTIAFPGTWKWIGGASSNTGNFKTTANAENLLVLEKIGSTVYAFLGGDLKV